MKQKYAKGQAEGKSARGITLHGLPLELLRRDAPASLGSLKSCSRARGGWWFLHPGHTHSSVLCEDAKSVWWMGDAPAGFRNQVWRNKRGFGSEWERSFMAKAGLMALLCSFGKWKISALCLIQFSERGEAIGNRLWSD